jgi:uncharacterized protein YbjT (DUF2867 family)
MKIVTTGSLGNIGLPLIKDLVLKGHEVTVISSNMEKKEDIEALGATAAIGSLNNRDLLTTTFTGADAVFVMVPPGYAEIDQMAYYQRLANNYAHAIQQAGIKRVVHLSSYGAHLDKGTGFILGAHYAEGILNKVPDISLTHLRPGYFYTNLYRFVDMIKGAGFIGSNYGGDDKLVMVSPADIAAAAAEELEKTTATKSIRYIISDERTTSEVASVLGKAIGKPDLQWLLLTEEQTKSGMEQAGVPSFIITNVLELNNSIHSGVLQEDYEKQKPIALGKTKLEAFAKEFAAAF